MGMRNRRVEPDSPQSMAPPGAEPMVCPSTSRVPAASSNTARPPRAWMARAVAAMSWLPAMWERRHRPRDKGGTEHGPVGHALAGGQEHLSPPECVLVGHFRHGITSQGREQLFPPDGVDDALTHVFQQDEAQGVAVALLI